MCIYGRGKNVHFRSRKFRRWFNCGLDLGNNANNKKLPDSSVSKRCSFGFSRSESWLVCPWLFGHCWTIEVNCAKVRKIRGSGKFYMGLLWSFISISNLYELWSLYNAYCKIRSFWYASDGEPLKCVIRQDILGDTYCLWTLFVFAFSTIKHIENINTFIIRVINMYYLLMSKSMQVKIGFFFRILIHQPQKVFFIVLL